jgi:hypothetical protein
VGLMDHSRWHFHRALDFAQGDSARVAAVLASAADMEKSWGEPNEALKFLQVAGTGIDPGKDPQATAALAGLSASSFLALGQADDAKRQVNRARSLFTEADHEKSLPFFFSTDQDTGCWQPHRANWRTTMWHALT